MPYQSLHMLQRFQEVVNNLVEKLWTTLLKNICYHFNSKVSSYH